MALERPKRDRATLDRDDAAARRRLEVDERREQLIQVGARLFGRQPYDQVWIEEIATEAGVSRGLLYHYFPTKRDFYAEVVRYECDALEEITAPDPSLPPVERMRASLDAYVRWVEENAMGYLTVNRAGVGVDDEIRAIVEDSQARQLERVMAEVTGGEPPTPALQLAVKGWLGFTVAASIEWLEKRAVSRDELRDLLVQALVGAITSAGEEVED